MGGEGKRGDIKDIAQRRGIHQSTQSWHEIFSSIGRWGKDVCIVLSFDNFLDSFSKIFTISIVNRLQIKMINSRRESVWILTDVVNVKIFFGPAILLAEAATSLIFDPAINNEISPPILVAAVIQANVPCVTVFPSCSATTRVEALREEESFQKVLEVALNIFYCSFLLLLCACVHKKRVSVCPLKILASLFSAKSTKQSEAATNPTMMKSLLYSAIGFVGVTAQSELLVKTTAGLGKSAVTPLQVSLCDVNFFFFFSSRSLQ
jgi:hypothetical protein